jgi:hypothetical protein
MRWFLGHHSVFWNLLHCEHEYNSYSSQHSRYARSDGCTTATRIKQWNFITIFPELASSISSVIDIVVIRPRFSLLELGIVISSTSTVMITVVLWSQLVAYIRCTLMDTSPWLCLGINLWSLPWYLTVIIVYPWLCLLTLDRPTLR